MWAVVPARRHSRRLPGKVLADVGGLPMVVRVCQRVVASHRFDRVAVATDDDQIADVCAGHGVDVIRTGPAPSGTHRVAAAVGDFGGCVVNVQADQPLVRLEHLAAMVDALAAGAAVVTLRAPQGPGDDGDPARVKVSVDSKGRATDFWRSAGRVGDAHIGLYGFAPGYLSRCANAPVTARTRAVDLEQLAWLDAGVQITVPFVDPAESAVDTPADLARVRAILQLG